MPKRLRRLAQRRCGKEGRGRHRCVPPLHAIVWGTSEANSCPWLRTQPRTSRDWFDVSPFCGMSGCQRHTTCSYD
eukprot:653672-Lingulodinium_polyedra.AAC.1